VKNKKNILEEKKREKEDGKKKGGKRKKEIESRSEEKTEKRPDFLFGKSDLYTLKSPKKISVED